MNPKLFLVCVLLGGVYLVSKGAWLLYTSNILQDILKGSLSVLAGIFLALFGLFGLKGPPPRGDINA